MSHVIGQPNKTMATGTCWYLERCFGDEFSAKSRGGVNVQVNNVIGINAAIPARIRALLRDGVTMDDNRNTRKGRKPSQVEVLDAETVPPAPA
jgi:hypothetical protein